MSGFGKRLNDIYLRRREGRSERREWDGGERGSSRLEGREVVQYDLFTTVESSFTDFVE